MFLHINIQTMSKIHHSTELSLTDQKVASGNETDTESE